MAKKLGANPLMGIDSLIRKTEDAPVAQEVHDVQNTQNTHKVQDVQSTQDTHEVQYVQSTQDAHEVQYVQNAQDIQKAYHKNTPSTQGRKGEKLPRINLAFQPKLLEYLQVMSGFDAVSITRYINKLIEEDMQNRMQTYEKISVLQKAEVGNKRNFTD